MSRSSSAICRRERSPYVIDIASPFGEIKRCDVLKSNLRNGRCPAVLFMTSDAQADAAINALNSHVDAHGQRVYARKEYSHQEQYPDRPPDRLQTLIRGTQNVTTQVKERTQHLSATQPSSTPKQLPPPKPASLFKATVKSVAKDGNCLFSAVELGDKSTVREVAVDWIESHLEDSLLGGQTYRSYIEEEKQVNAEVYCNTFPICARLASGAVCPSCTRSRRLL
eukprot:796027-Prymnesium_polylepis.2